METLPPVRINDCGLADYPSGGRLGPRVLSDYEILWIERGECRWEYAGRFEICRPGSVLLCPPRLRDVWVWDPVRTTRHGFVHFDFLQSCDPDLPRRRDCPANDVLRPLLRHCVSLASQDDTATDSLAAIALSQALTWYQAGLLAPSSEVATIDVHPVILRSLRVLGRYWGDGPKLPPSIDHWARDTGISRGHFSRVCREELGVTPLELLRHLRLDHGLLLLARTNMKINEISEACGFQNQFHFSRCCRQAYGHSPRELRRQMLAGGDKPLSKVIGLRRLLQLVG